MEEYVIRNDKNQIEKFNEEEIEVCIYSTVEKIKILAASR